MMSFNLLYTTGQLRLTPALPAVVPKPEPFLASFSCVSSAIWKRLGRNRKQECSGQTPELRRQSGLSRAAAAAWNTFYPPSRILRALWQRPCRSSRLLNQAHAPHAGPAGTPGRSQLWSSRFLNRASPFPETDLYSAVF